MGWLKERQPKVSNALVRASRVLGGADLFDYTRREERISCDKGSHKERSIANQRNHIKFWKKVQRNGGDTT